MYVLHLPSGTRADANALGHYRLWVKGICHGDISLRNLMCDFPAGTGNPVGILNDFDLATWVGHRTTNNDRTGTIPFMALDLLDGGLDRRIPRLYRHDLESFCWVLAYVTVAQVKYKSSSIEIFPLSGVDAWFKDANRAERDAHILSKQRFRWEYGGAQDVSGRHVRYRDIIRRIIYCWYEFHESLRASRKYSTRSQEPNPMAFQAEPDVSEPVDDDPTDSLRTFIKTVEGLFKEGDNVEGFPAVKNLLEAVVVDINAP